MLVSAKYNNNYSAKWKPFKIYGKHSTSCCILVWCKNKGLIQIAQHLFIFVYFLIYYNFFVSQSWKIAQKGFHFAGQTKSQSPFCTYCLPVSNCCKAPEIDGIQQTSFVGVHFDVVCLKFLFFWMRMITWLTCKIWNGKYRLLKMVDKSSLFKS